MDSDWLVYGVLSIHNCTMIGEHNTRGPFFVYSITNQNEEVVLSDSLSVFLHIHLIIQ